MEFDNSDFEKKTKESMSTIEKLKESLNFEKGKEALKTFATQANELDFNGLKDSIETISNRFSNLGIVGMTVISRLTNAMVDGVSKITRSITNMIATGGVSRAMNIEQAKFQLAGLGIEWDKIKEDIDYGVKDTAYGLDAAARAAAQLAASSVEIGDDMKTSLRAISGVAAMTGASYDDIARVFEAGAGQGRVMMGELTRLAERGVNATAVLAKALGKTEAEIREMASNSEIDFMTFAKAMDDAFGQHAKDANKTLTGTLDNIRSAWSRVGAEFVQPIIRNEGELVELLNAYREKINDIKEGIIPIAKVTTDLLNRILSSITKTVKGIDIKEKVVKIGEGIKGIIQAFEKLIYRLKYIGRQIKGVFTEIFPKKESKDITAAFKKIIDAIGQFNINSKTVEKFKDIFKGFFSLVAVGIKVFKNLAVVVKPLFKYIVSESSKMLDIAAAVGRLITKLTEGTLAAKDFEFTFEKITESIQGSLDKIKDGFMSLVGVFQDDEKGAKDAFDAIVDIVSGAVETILTLVEDITGLDLSVIKDSFEEFSKKAKYFLRSMYDVYKQAGGGIEGFAAVFAEVLKKLGNKIVDFIEKATGIDLGKLKTKVEDFFKTVKSKVESFLNAVKPLEKIGNTFTFVKDRVKELSMALSGLAQSAMIGLGKLLENPVGSLVGIKGSFALIDRLNQLIRDGAITKLVPQLFDVKKAFTSMTSNMNANQILKIAASIVALGYAFKVMAGGVAELASVPKFENTLGALTEMIIAMGGLFMGLKVTIGALKDINFNGKSVIRPIDQMKATFKLSSTKLLATSVLVLAMSKSLKILVDALSEIVELDGNLGQHITACVEIFGLLLLLGESLKKLSGLKPVTGLDGKFFIIYASTFVLLAEAVKIMADAFATLNSEVIKIDNFGDLIDTLLSFGILIGILASLVYSLNKIKITNVQNLFALGLGILALSEGVKVLVEAVAILKDVDAENALMGLVVVFSLLFEVLRGASMLAGTAISLKTSVGLLAIAAAVAWLTHEINVLAQTPMISIIKGFTALIGILGALTVTASLFTMEMPGVKAAGFAMLEFAASIWIITKAIQNLAKIPIDNIAERLTLLLSSIVIFAFTLKSFEMNNATAGLALLEVGAALFVIAEAVKMLSGMDIFDILKGMGSLILFLELLCVTTSKFALALPGAQAMLVMAASLAVLAVSLKLLADAKLWAFAAVAAIGIVVVGLMALGASATVAAPAIEAGAMIIATAMFTLAAGLMAVTAVIAVFALSMGLIAISGIAAADAVKAFSAAMLEMLTNTYVNVSALSRLSVVVATIAGALVAGAVALIGFGVGLAAFGVGAAAAAVGATLLAVAVSALALALEYLITVLQSANLVETVDALGLETGKQLSESTAQGIQQGSGTVKAAVKDLVKNALVGPMDHTLGINSPSKVMAEKGKFIDMGLAEGISGNQDVVKLASEQLGKTASTSLSNSIAQGTNEGSKTLEQSVKVFGDIASKGSVAAGYNVGTGFMKGLQTIAPKVKQYAANLGKAAYMSMKQYLKIKSPSRLMMELGEYTGEGFAIGMNNTESNIENSAEDLGKTAEQSLTTALSAAYDNLTSDVTDPVIKPVLDLSNIQNGASSIDSMLSRDYASNIAANYRNDRDYQAEQNAMNNQLLSGLNGQLLSAIASNNMSDLPINVNVQLVGDAEGLFRTVVAENKRWTNMAGSSLLMQG